ncbi:DNA replication complex GINS family protein [archaeon]|nr:DNA replication complex GINS family protein [archaeon]MBT6762348.1 DNA replication complex GINS family protein [archaeon]
MANINITLETLYDVLRNEKKSEELQQLEKTFFIDVVSYLREKKSLVTSRQDEDELFATSDRKKLEYEMRSIKRILKEIYEKREKKLIAIALNKSRTGSDIIDTGSMLPEEKEFFSKVVSHFDNYRRGILLQLWRAELPLIQTGSSVLQTPVTHSSKSSVAEALAADDPTTVAKINESAKLDAKSPSSGSESEPAEEKENNAVVKIKFLHPVPRFVWKDMKEYGPFESGDETEIFPEIAELLERKGRAEIV